MSEEVTVQSEVIQNVVEQVMSSGKKWKVLSHNLEHFSTNFCDMKRLKVKVKDETNGNEQEYQFLLKHSPINRNDGNDLYRNRAFKKEAFFYSTLAPLMNKCLADRGEPPLQTPKVYHHNCDFKDTDTDNKVMMIIQEDLTGRGFRAAKDWTMDFEHSKLVFEEISRFHSASFLLQADQIALVDKYPLLFETFMMEGHCEGLQKMFRDGTSTMSSRCESKPHLAKLKAWLDRMVPHTFALITNQLVPRTPVSAICHSDLHSNNVLFRYDSSGVPMEVMFIDFQVIRVMPVSVDLNYFGHFSLKTSTRKVIFPDLLDRYYAKMEAILSDGIPFTKDQFMTEVQGNDTGLFYGLLLLPFAIAFIENLGGSDQILTSSTQQQMIDIIQELGEEAHRVKIYEKYDNIQEHLYKW